MKQDSLTITALGYKAEQVLQEINSLKVVGQASRGIYLQPQEDLTLFISTERYRGPLTLNASGEPPLLKLFEPGTSVEILDSKLIFPDLNLHISLKMAEIWNTPHLPIVTSPAAVKLDTFTEQIRTLAEKDPLYPLLDWITNESTTNIINNSGVIRKLIEILNEGHNHQLSVLQDKLIRLLGVGPGLTPLGDDLVLGALLVLNRGNSLNFHMDELGELNQEVIQSAWRKSTRISASLLECAAEGAADERLLQVLDGLLSGDPIADHELHDLLKWGSTSGIAVLAGMLYVLLKNKGHGIL